MQTTSHGKEGVDKLDIFLVLKKTQKNNMIKAHLRFANVSIWSLRQIDTGRAALNTFPSPKNIEQVVNFDPTVKFFGLTMIFSLLAKQK